VVQAIVTGTAAAIVRALADGPSTARELSDRLDGVSYANIRQLLRRLTKAGVVTKLRRGLYGIGGEGSAPTVAHPASGSVALAALAAAFGLVAQALGPAAAAELVDGMDKGPGAWRPRLRPFEIDLVERWDNSGWNTVELAPEPLGGVELGCGTYRITATVGSFGTPPADVVEAARRLAAYQVGIAGIGADVGPKDLNIGELRVSSERWPARAMQLSGAADLLRPYRDLGAGAWA
jgi:DNA-binding transcriptional ArsR family regulator